MANNLSPDLQDQQYLENRTVPRQRFLHQETVNDAVGQWLIIPAGIGDLLASVEPAAGSARIEYTQDSVADVEADTAVGKPWDQSDVTAYADSLMANAVTAIRCVAVGGAADFKVSA